MTRQETSEQEKQREFEEKLNDVLQWAADQKINPWFLLRVLESAKTCAVVALTVETLQGQIAERMKHYRS